MMQVRPPELREAADICRLIRASIVELCLADHQNDPAVLAAWLANKTTDNVSAWLTNPNVVNLVAAEADVLLAAGCVTRQGEIVLNYVSPPARFRGASSALLLGLEAAARREGNARCDLHSTRTAHGFYQARGYQDVGDPVRKHGLTALPMTKML